MYPTLLLVVVAIIAYIRYRTKESKKLEDYLCQTGAVDLLLRVYGFGDIENWDAPRRGYPITKNRRAVIGHIQRSAKENKRFVGKVCGENVSITLVQPKTLLATVRDPHVYDVLYYTYCMMTGKKWQKEFGIIPLDMHISVYTPDPMTTTATAHST